MSTETINGVTFEDWAAACAHSAQGMSTEEVLNILGLEAPVWEETTAKWAERLGQLGAEDMNITTVYADIFTNPNVGKFAGKGNVSSIEDVVTQKVPDYETYQKIFSHVSAASNYGIDLSNLLEKEYGLNLGQWSQVSSHWGKYSQENLGNGSTTAQREFFDYSNRITEKYEAHWDSFYQDQKANLGNDIDF